MKTKFTTGPWKVREGEIHVDSLKKVIAQVFPQDDKEETMANANLISSSPDLYESLVDLINWCEAWDMKPMNLDKAKAAILKANP